jgi:hypothetical protein
MTAVVLLCAIALQLVGKPPANPQPETAANQALTKHDSGPNWSNWALVIVGMGGIVVAVGTLKTIAKQARLMQHHGFILRRQTRATQKAAEAADKNIEMFISKDRARLRVDLRPPDLSPKGDHVYTVDFAIKVYGATDAYIADSKCAAYVVPWELISEPEIFDAAMFPIPSLPKVISANKPVEQYAFFTGEHMEELLPEIKQHKLFVGVRGFIKYKDVFDRDRETRFRYIWKFSSYGGEGFGNWEPCGAQDENKET